MAEGKDAKAAAADARELKPGTPIGGYVIEGHVPASDVKRLLAAKPKATGIAVPGMVVGSPGMEQGGLKEPYKVVLFDKSGKTRVFASH